MLNHIKLWLAAAVFLAPLTGIANQATSHDTTLTPQEHSSGCAVDFGHSARLLLPKSIVGRCPKSGPLLKRESIGFFITYPDMTTSSQPVKLTNKDGKFWIDVVSLYQNYDGNSEWGFWPSGYMKNIEDENGKYVTLSTPYPGLLKIFQADFLKRNPSIKNDISSPGTFVIRGLDANILFMQCDSDEKNPMGQCVANVYDDSSHFEYEMYFPVAYVGKTTEIIAAIKKMLTQWALK